MSETVVVIEPQVYILEIAGGESVPVVEELVSIVEVGIQGPEGAQGPQGPPGSGGGGTPGGANTQLQYNNSGAFGGTAAFTYATSGTLLTGTAQATTDTVLDIKDRASQSAATQRWLNSSGTADMQVEAPTASRTHYLAFPAVTASLMSGLRWFRAGAYEAVFEADGNGNFTLKGTSGALATCFTGSVFDGSVTFGGALGTNGGMSWGSIPSAQLNITCNRFTGTRIKTLGIKTYRSNGATQDERFYITASNTTTNGATVGVTNASFVVGEAALATNATDGFLYLPTCAGTPTGTPTSMTGTVAAVYDTSSDKLFVYNGGWKSVTLA